VGYTVVNFKRLLRVNLEFDYTAAQFDFFSLASRRVNFYTFMVNVEYNFFPDFPMAVYFGIGTAIIHYCCPPFGNWGKYIQVGNQNLYPMASSLGLKLALGKRLNFRLDFRHYWESAGDTDIYFSEGYWDIYWDPYIDEWNSFGSSLSLGLEYRF
jgi:hypothetical protein